MISKKYFLAIYFFLFLFIFQNCEVNRINKNFVNQGFLSYLSRLLSSRSTSQASPTPPISTPLTVVSTTPADNSIDVSLLPTSYSIKFSGAVNPTTVTTSTSGNSCTGSVQISDDNFTTCIPASSQPITTDTISYTINLSLPISFRADVVYKIKVTTSVLDTNGVALSSYTSTNGFRTGTPCGHNCFFSGSPLTASAGAGSSSFLIQSGSNSGKQLIIHGNSTTTTLFDFTNQTVTVGPVSPSSIGTGSSNAFLSSGANAGKTLVFRASVTTGTFIYDPIANSFSVGTVSPFQVTTGSFSFTIQGGVNAGKIFYFRSGAQRQWALYQPSTDTYLFNSPATDFASNVSGGFVFLIQSGVNTGKYFIAHGGNTDASIYDPDTNSLTYVGAGASLTVGGGSKSFYIASGIHIGKNLIYYGGTTATRLYDHTAGTNSIGPNLLGSIGPNSLNFPITTGSNSGKTLILQGGGSNVSYIYDPATNSFSLGPTLASGTTGVDSHFFTANGGLYPTATYVVNAGSTNTINLYFP
jgi:hypothetical protein